jgi:pimeloyl-ACP methyl ester carboxylesterase
VIFYFFYCCSYQSFEALLHVVANQNFIQNRLQNTQVGIGFGQSSPDLKHHLGSSGKPFRHATSIVKKTPGEVLVVGTPGSVTIPVSVTITDSGEEIANLETFSVTSTGKVVDPITGSVVGTVSSDGSFIFLNDPAGLGIVDNLDIAGNTVKKALRVGKLADNHTYRYNDRVEKSDKIDIFRFNVSDRSNLSVALKQFGGDAEINLFRDVRSGEDIKIAGGRRADIFTRILSKGNYYIEVKRRTGDVPYNLEFKSVELSGSVENTNKTESYPLQLWAYDKEGRILEGKGINPNKETVVFVHGLNNSDQDAKMRELAITGAATGVQVISVNWGSIAKAGLDKLIFGLDSTPYRTANWIGSVAAWTHNRLEAIGFDQASTNLSFVGHSLGSYVSAKTAQLFGSVKNLVALDPAFPATGYDIDINPGRIEAPPNFSSIANQSVAFVVADGISRVGLAGDNKKAATAKSSFTLTFSKKKLGLVNAHGAVIDAFNDAIERNLISLSDVELRNGKKPFRLFESYQPDWYNDGGKKDNEFDQKFFPGRHEGNINVKWTGVNFDWKDKDGKGNPVNPWRINRLNYVIDSTGREGAIWQ